MNGLQFAKLIRFRTRTNSTTFSDADLVAVANMVKDKLATKVIKADENIFTMPMYANLAVKLDGSPQREYPMPGDILSKIKRVEAMLDGSEYILLDELQLNQYKDVTDEATIVANFQNIKGMAFYELTRRSIKLYTGTFGAVSRGLKLHANIYPADITATTLTLDTDISIDPTTTSFGLPRELHPVWVDGVVIEWKNSREKPIPLTESELLWDKNVNSAISDIRNANQDREIIASVPRDDGSEY